MPNLMNKKGTKFVPDTMGGLIATIAGCIVVLIVVIAIYVYAISPNSTSIGCGLNTRVRSATIGTSAGFLPAPILMCSQYNNPVNINAADFNACSGIADFCKTTKDKNILYTCYQQCARIQVDKLTDSCWTMAGSGRLNLWSSWDRLGKITDDIINSLKLAWDTNAALFKLNPQYLVTSVTLGWQNPLDAVKSDIDALFAQKAAILRCFRFQIVNPVIIPGTKQQAQYFDLTFGRSWAYNITDPKVCKPSENNPICSLGGSGVKYINEIGDIKFKLFGIDITIPKEEAQLAAGAFLQYNMAPKQICYISYYEYEYGVKRTVISCNSWAAYTGSFLLIN